MAAHAVRACVYAKVHNAFFSFCFVSGVFKVTMQSNWSVLHSVTVISINDLSVHTFIVLKFLCTFIL